MDFTIWSKLANVDYEKSEDEYGEVLIPAFSSEIKAMANKEITLPGYIMPFEGMFQPKHIFLSSLPAAACYFCGSGGPESVAEVYLDEPIQFTNEIVQIKGILKLNATDYNQMMYILDEAKLVE
ncbi:MAG: hypothetical protein RJQ09_08025 [Cyclobacteriaceae bacterium]